MAVMCFEWHCKPFTVFTHPTYHPLIFLMGKNIYFVILLIYSKVAINDWYPFMTFASQAGWSRDYQVVSMSPWSLSFPAMPYQFHISAPSFLYLCGHSMTSGKNRDCNTKLEGERVGPINFMLCASSNRCHKWMFTELLLSGNLLVLQG